MYKYMILLALAVAVIAAPPEAPKDLNTANQLLYSYGAAYPSVYSSGYVAPAYGSYGYAGYPAYGGYNYGYRVLG